MSKFAKGHNARKTTQKLIWYSTHHPLSLIIPYQLTKFQAPNSNSFWDILPTSLKCPNLQKAATAEKFEGICSYVDQVIYSSSPIS